MMYANHIGPHLKPYRGLVAERVCVFVWCALIRLLGFFTQTSHQDSDLTPALLVPLPS